MSHQTTSEPLPHNNSQSSVTDNYYVPEQSIWPIVGAVALFLIAYGAGTYINQLPAQGGSGSYILLAGIGLILFMVIGWWRNVISESMAGLYSAQMDRSFRQGMAWFILSEVMFFFALFGALFYVRQFAIPWLGGAGNNAMTHEILWPEFQATWPLILTPSGTTTQAMGWYGLPLFNTLILVTSSITLHFAHVAIEKGKRLPLQIWLTLTIILGIVFLGGQVMEYQHAYQDLDLTLDAGIYGNTFFVLTGFHGMHVCLGAVFLLVLWFRIAKGHFTPENHFAFQAGSWYWHFVDVVWLCLFVFVYII